MRLKLRYMRANGAEDDIVVTADAGATIAEVATSIAVMDPMSTGRPPAAPTLHATLPGQPQGVLLPPDATLGEAWIGSGASVSVVDAETHFGQSAAADEPVLARLRVVDGPDAGLVQDIRRPSVSIGRDAACDIVLSDELVSKRHARLEIAEALELIDLGSANGLVVDEIAVPRLRAEGAIRVLIGADTVEVTAVAADETLPLRPGPVPFNRSPKVEVRYAGDEFTPPEVPREEDQPPFAVIALLTPMLMGGAMFLITQRPISLLFCLLSPMMMVGNWWANKRNKKRKLRRAIGIFQERLAEFTRVLEREQELERTARLEEAPSTETLYDEAMRYGRLLWTRRPEHWSFLNVRLGKGAMPTRNTVLEQGKGELLPEFQEQLDAVIERTAMVDGVPLIDNLYDAGALGIAGTPGDAAGSLNGVLVQLTSLHAPSELVISAIVSQQWSRELSWLKWMPHASSPQSPIEGVHLADGQGTANELIGSLEGLLQRRMQRGGAVRRGAMAKDKAALERGAEVGSGKGDAIGTPSPVPAVVVVVSDDVGIERSRLVQLAELGPDAGVFVIWVASDVSGLPAACRTYLSVPADGGASVGFVRLGVTSRDIEIEPISRTRALEYGRRMAPVYDAGALVEDDSDLPRSVSLISLLGDDLAEQADAVIDRWKQNESINDRTPGATMKPRRAGKLRATIGSAGVDVMQLDLRTQGPHALVGGTTGAGKSEFLQAWVLGMAAEYSSDRVTFLFVDYKGGSAFAECVNLPHCVGLVTDLSPHLVRRALTSLRAELHHREHLLNRKKAKDLLELEKRGDPECPPALVLVIDEFAALVSEVPEFVNGVIDIAQRGRSLGIHLIMATQRPAGVIRDNLRANTPLRIALRMADDSDSNDVIGVKDAAHFSPGTPGRGIAKTGPGRLTPFQSGYAGGWTTREPDRARIEVAELRFGAELRWDPPKVEESTDDADPGPTDQQRMVRTIIEGTQRAGIPAPRRPWLDELALAYDLSLLRQRTDTELVLGVSDLPEHQQQRTAYFRPDADGHLALFGTGGSGKSTVLRTLGIAAGIVPRGGPVQVYGLDFGSGGLRALEQLPHVGAVIQGDDGERIIRLFRRIAGLLEDRAQRFAEANAANITEYRALSGNVNEPRILLLLDNYPSFRDEWESTLGRIPWYQVFRDILSEGRQLGIHVAMSADRPGSVPTNVSSSIQRRVVLRLADEMGYTSLDVDADILSASSPPGRAIIDGVESQVAVIGGSRVLAEQASATSRLAESMRRAGVPEAPAVGSLPMEFSSTDLPDTIDGAPVLGISETELGPQAFALDGVLLVSGPPASGRTNALKALCRAIDRAQPDARQYYIGNPRSPLVDEVHWVATAVTVEEAQALAKALTAAIGDPETEGKIAVVIESVTDFLQTPADAAIAELVKAVKRSDHFLLAENETAGWSASWGMLSEIKSVRRGLLLQPDYTEGEFILKTPLARASRSEYPPGRGMFIARGKAVRVQLPYLAGEPAVAPSEERMGTAPHR